MMELTEFQKSKMKEWEEFGKQYPFSWMQEFKDSWMYLFCLIVILLLAIVPQVNAGEWNEKPIMCANEVETFDAIKSKEEELVFKATQLTKVRTDTGLARRPVAVSVDMYVNTATGTYTIVEFHPTYESYCVISYGTNFQVFIGGVQ
tara:strand:+ start:3387 stop:3827 length:441 start_codon:yes stop_codon:yes gene_type:complete